MLTCVDLGATFRLCRIRDFHSNKPVFLTVGHSSICFLNMSKSRMIFVLFFSCCYLIMEVLLTLGPCGLIWPSPKKKIRSTNKDSQVAHRAERDLHCLHTVLE